ncbi:MAG: ABC transporter ATP-binding protein [Mycobacteriales bacterium]
MTVAAGTVEEPGVRAAALELRGVTQRFGGVVALDALELTVPSGSIFALIGPNGAGKTTVFNLVTGVYRPTSGSLWFDGERISGRRPHQVTRAGIARTFQNIRLFENMTALENVQVGADARHKSSVVGAALGLPRFRREERDGNQRGAELLDFVGIARVAGEPAKALSYGDQRRLEIARALATRPQLMLLDEPAAGMNPVEKDGLMQLIRRIRDTGVTIFLIEHDMGLVMQASDRLAALDFGQKIADDVPSAVRSDLRVIEAYLGADADAS